LYCTLTFQPIITILKNRKKQSMGKKDKKQKKEEG